MLCLQELVKFSLRKYFLLYMNVINIPIISIVAECELCDLQYYGLKKMAWE